MSLVLENVTYRYSQGTAYEITALNHVNLSIGDGEKSDRSHVVM